MGADPPPHSSLLFMSVKNYSVVREAGIQKSLERKESWAVVASRSSWALFAPGLEMPRIKARLRQCV